MFESTTIGASAAAASAAGAPRGLVGAAGPSSNTDLPNCAPGDGLKHSNALKPGSKFSVLHLGFDTLEWNLSLDDPELEGLVQLLAPMVGAGEQQDSQYAFVVSRVGGLVHRYKVQFSHGFDVYLPDVGFSRYGLRVVAHSKACLMAEDVQVDAVAVLVYLTGAHELALASRLSLSRVDVCLDLLMPGADYQRFCKQVATRGSSVVTRARKIDSYLDGDRYTGVSVGQEKVKLRSYDKKAEAVQGGDWALWSEVYGRGEGFDVPDGQVVPRFEYQLRRGFLRECCVHGVELHHEGCPGLRSLADFRAASADVLAYLTGDWFRLAGAARGKNHERPLRPFWREVRAGFLDAAWSSFSGSLRRQLKRFVSTNVEQLADMAAGCLATLAAVLGHAEGQEEGLPAPRVLGFLGRHMDRGRERWEQRRDRRYRQLPYGSKLVPV